MGRLRSKANFYQKELPKKGTAKPDQTRPAVQGPYKARAVPMQGPSIAYVVLEHTGLGFVTSLIFIFFVGIFASSWMGATVFWLGERFNKRVPFMKHIYSASKQISAAISPDQNSTAFKEVAIIRHPRLGEYAFGFITSSVVLQILDFIYSNAELVIRIVFHPYGLVVLFIKRDDGDEELCSVYVPTNHLYIADIFSVNSKEIIRPNLSIREGIEIIVSAGMTMPQMISPIERVPYQSNRILLDRMM